MIVFTIGIPILLWLNAGWWVWCAAGPYFVLVGLSFSPIFVDWLLDLEEDDDALRGD